MALHAAGRLQEAEGIYRTILETSPANADALHLAGVAAGQQGRHTDAVRAIGRAIEIQPKAAAYRHNLGNILAEMGRLGEAAQAYEEALRIEPGYAEAHAHLGNTLFRLKRAAEAAVHYREALRRQPASAEVRRNLTVALLHWAAQKFAARELAEAEALLREAIGYSPEMAEAHSDLGAVLFERERLEDAEACLREALARKPALSRAHNTLGSVLHARGCPREAIACFDLALLLAPDYAAAWNNRGLAQQALNHLEEALLSYGQAVRLQSDFAEARTHRAMALLACGDSPEGWREYEWRWKIGKFPPRRFAQPLWDGAPLEGKTILLYAEQGLGDTIQFIRYARLVKQKGGTVLVECPPRLRKLIAAAPGVDGIAAAGDPLPPFDVQAPLLSLPWLLDAGVVPVSEPYLSVDANLVARWGERIAARADGRQCKIGLVWEGYPMHRGDAHRYRSMDPACLLPLAEIPGVKLFSLQRDAAPPEGLPAVVLERSENGIEDTAAILLHLDLLLTVDSMPAHLAGALGRPVWNLLPFAAEWRWGLDRRDTPWYPTMRLFRQERAGDWRAPVEEVCETLKNAHPV